MRHLIGFGGSVHDFATCVLGEDGRMVAIEDERLSRVRYAFGDPEPCRTSLEYCLRAVGHAPGDGLEFGANDMLRGVIGVPERDIVWMNHHLAHAMSVLFTSPFQEAAIVVADGAGSVVSSTAAHDAHTHCRETTTWAWGQGNDIRTLGQVIGRKRGGPDSNDVSALMSNSLGDLYRAVTEAVGFGFLQAGKTMGLASYGDDRFVDRLMSAVELLPGGQFTIDVAGSGGVLQILKGIRRGSLEEDFDTNAAIAAAGQIVLETVLFHVLEEVWEQTHCPNLCLAGGVALNCVFNGKIAERTPFRDVHVVFAPGDSGTAIGSAVHRYLSDGSCTTPFRLQTGPYLGRDYGRDAEMTGHQDRLPDEVLYRKVASLLHQGKVVAWFQGGAEFGPRALGHRSLLADPTRAAMRPHLNRVKSREWFRPFAPVVIEKHRTDYFEGAHASPYMQFSYPVKAGMRDRIPAVCHVDGTARLQSVDDWSSPELAELIREFVRQGGPPVLLNTSLNLRGEPIVETPRQALDAFAGADIDALVLCGRLLVK
ncbi:carbamoyltransferase C-terminal domain-containing protein [Streptomyces sp. NPDC049099]|uniref:carbamoyltransferase family protein n=1 Tax=Streptomyces sp. NPDC049099 TaxID=3155768 RepID=UPI0034281834